MKRSKNLVIPVGGLLVGTLLLGSLALHPVPTSAHAGKPVMLIARVKQLAQARLADTAAKETPEAADPAAKPGKSLEDLIKETGLPYKSVGDGQFLLTFPTGDTTTTNMIVGESALAGQEKLKVITIACKVMDGAKDKKPSQALLLKIAAFDYQTDLGRIGVDKNNTVWYQSSLWKSTATGESLAYDLVFADDYRQKQAKILQPVSDEG